MLNVYPGSGEQVEFIYKDIIDTIPINVFNNIKELIKIALPPEIIHIDNDAFTGSGITQECINQIKQINPFEKTKGLTGILSTKVTAGLSIGYSFNK